MDARFIQDDFHGADVGGVEQRPCPQHLSETAEGVGRPPLARPNEDLRCHRFYEFLQARTDTTVMWQEKHVPTDVVALGKRPEGGFFNISS